MQFCFALPCGQPEQKRQYHRSSPCSHLFLFPPVLRLMPCHQGIGLSQKQLATCYWSQRPRSCGNQHTWPVTEANAFGWPPGFHWPIAPRTSANVPASTAGQVPLTHLPNPSYPGTAVPVCEDGLELLGAVSPLHRGGDKAATARRRIC